MGKRRRWSDADLSIAVAQSSTFREVLGRLGLREAGGNYPTVKSRIGALQLDTSHFRGTGWRRGSTKPVTPAAPLDELLVEGSTYQSFKLKRRLIREGRMTARCGECRLENWNGAGIPLELDHINGIRDDNRIENLRLVCPNCHAQTPTYRGRNIGKT